MHMNKIGFRNANHADISKRGIVNEKRINQWILSLLPRVRLLPVKPNAKVVARETASITSIRFAHLAQFPRTFMRRRRHAFIMHLVEADACPSSISYPSQHASALLVTRGCWDTCFVNGSSSSRCWCHWHLLGIVGPRRSMLVTCMCSCIAPSNRGSWSRAYSSLRRRVVP